jgi:hypothetical protein
MADGTPTTELWQRDDNVFSLLDLWDLSGEEAEEGKEEIC